MQAMGTLVLVACFTNCPFGQSSHFALPGTDCTLPASHGLHLELPAASAWYWPTAQNLQVCCPPASENLPCGQGLHSFPPLPSWNWPFSQYAQLAPPPTLW
jgi:hypothetical protein